MDRSMTTTMDEGNVWAEHHGIDPSNYYSQHNHDIIPRSLGHWSASIPPSTNTSLSTSTAWHQNGQISPVSTSMDIPIPPSTPSSAQNHGYHEAPSNSTSLSSSVTSRDSWHTMDEYNDSADGDTVEMLWEREDDDEMVMMPKLEPSDEDFCLDDIKAAPRTPTASTAASSPKIKKARGRPRKHPLTPAAVSSKVTKGRSKTGCITCRKRKKKCDEAKPRCLNCKKNAVVCEGYPGETLWRSGKERATDTRSQSQPLPVITLQPIFEGLETAEDMIFWRHYNNQLSTVLTVEVEETKNAFTSMLIPVATRNRGLMHSILALSSKHFDYDRPYPTPTSREALDLRAKYHHEKARELFHKNMDRKEDTNDPDRHITLMACYSQILCFFLESLAEGNPRGEHRLHLNAYRALLEHAPPPTAVAQFPSFVVEFFQYHIFADELLLLPKAPPASLPAYAQVAALETWTAPVPIHTPRLFGVADGLCTLLAQITILRNVVRRNIAVGADFVTDYSIIRPAADIDFAIKDWNPQWPVGDGRARVTLLWQQTMWIYLSQTICPPQSATPGHSMANSRESLLQESGMEAQRRYQDSQDENSLDLGVLANTPPLSTSPSLASSPPPSVTNNAERLGAMIRLSGPGPGFGMGRSMSHPQPGLQVEPYLTHSRSYSFFQPEAHGWPLPQPHPYSHPQPHEQSQSQTPTHPHAQIFPNSFSPISSGSTTDTQQPRSEPDSRPSSPPPIPLPPSYSPRISTAISESLVIISSFSPTEPAQRLLLIPCLLIGTACYTPQQQETVREAVRTVRAYTGLRNADRVGEVLERVWGFMREGAWEKCWDWQSVVAEMGLDFLCA